MTDKADFEARGQRIRELVDDFRRRQQAGEAVSEQSLIAAHDELMPELAAALAAPGLIAEARAQVEAKCDASGAASLFADTRPSSGLHIRCPHCHTPVEIAADTPVADITCTACGSHFSLTGEQMETRAAGPVTAVGHFELVERLGLGGFGTVWRARDTELDRTVAVKIPRKGQLQPEEVEQFLREARTAAQLHHPNIVGVHEVGRDGDTVYIVADLVRGVPLSDWLTVQRLTVREAAELCRKIAEALHHAHEKGVIHRDLKPQNIMIDDDRQPKLMDFGLARREAGEVTVTLDGQLLGTPAYMSPEQAQGEAHRADRRSDVYSLGVILFELLTGELPFRGNARMLIHQVIHEEAPSPRKLNGHVPRDLETVCLKCLEKDPRKRFDSAGNVGEELGRFLNGEAIEARPISNLARAWRWCKRKPAVSSLAAGLVAALLAGLVGVTSQWIRADKEAGEREQARREAAARAEEADRARRRSDQLSLELAMDRGVSLCEQGRVGHGLLWFARALEIAPAGASDFQRVIRANLADWRRELHAVRALLAHPSCVTDATFSPDGKVVLTACVDGKARLWDADTCQLIAAPLDHGGGRMSSVAISLDGSRILTASERRTVCLWDARTAELILETVEHDHIVWCLAFSPDGRRFVTGSDDGTVQLWDVETAKSIGKPLMHEGRVRDVVFSPDGSLILSGSHDKTAHLWDARTQNAIGVPLEHQALVRAVAFSPDGSRFLTGCGDGTIHLWDVETQQAVAEPLRHQSSVRSVAFNAKGNRFLTGHGDNTCQLWDTATRTPIGPPIHQQGAAHSIAFNPQDDRTFLTGSLDGIVRIWEPAARRLPRKALSHDSGVNAVAFSPDGSRVGTGCADFTASVWDATTYDPIGTPLVHDWPVQALAFNADGSRILTGCLDASARLWNANTGERIGILWHRKPERGRAREWGVWAVAFGPTDETVALTGSFDGTVCLWQLTTGKRLRTFPHGGQAVTGTAFSPDGRRILTACHDFNAYVWDVDTGKVVGRPLRHRTCVLAVAISPDGSIIVTGCADNTASLWDAETYEPIGKPLEHEGLVRSVFFSPDGTMVLTGSTDGTARLWDVVTSKPVGVPLRHEVPVDAVAYGPAGKKIATGCDDGRVYLWDPPSDPLAGDVERTVLWTQVITGQELGADGAIRNLDTEGWRRRRQLLHKLGGPPSW